MSLIIIAIAGHVVSQKLFGRFYISPIFTLIIMGVALGASKFFSDILSLFYVRESHSKLYEGFYTDSGVVCALHQQPGTWAVVGFLALDLVIPNLVRRILDPTMVTKYTSEIGANEEAVQDMGDDRMAA